MARFSLTFPAFSTTTSSKTAMTIHADAAGEEAEIQELLMTGSGSTSPADTAHRATVQRLDASSAGTGTSQTPVKLDARSGAATLAGTVNYSAEPTAYLLVEALTFGFNQRGGMRWAVPKGQGILISNAVGGVKGGVKAISSAAGAVDATLIWEEA